MTGIKKPVTGKLDTSNKKTQIKKQKSESHGAWPCRINGCNRQFAREADLKRHQRTTKLHTELRSQSIICPQCDKTFTRTDALRRHQRSRHNGVIIEPMEVNSSKTDDNNGEGSSTSVSRSSSPAISKRKRAMSPPTLLTSVPVQTVVTPPDTSGPSSGLQSYYRHHTFSHIFIAPRTPNGVLETPQYPISTQIPANVPRVHAWFPNPPWIQENPGGTSGSIGNPVTFIHPSPGYFMTSPYYRAPDGQPLAPGFAVTGASHTDPSPQQHQSNMTTNLEDDGRTLKEEKPPDPGSDSTASVLESDTREENEDFCVEERTQHTHFSGNFDDTELSAAVKKALQVVLSFDPTLNSTVTKCGTEVQDMDEVVGLKPTTTMLTECKHPDRRSSFGFDGKSTEGETDTANEYIFHDQSSASESDNSSCMIPIPEGIKDLINEDPTSFAITS